MDGAIMVSGTSRCDDDAPLPDAGNGAQCFFKSAAVAGSAFRFRFVVDDGPLGLSPEAGAGVAVSVVGLGSMDDDGTGSAWTSCFFLGFGFGRATKCDK